MTRLNELKEVMKEDKAYALLVRSTDRYFNEYVPEYLSPRAYFTHFNGSVGDALITLDQSHLFVDGRYELQAHAQALDFSIHVCKNNTSIENSWLSFISENLKALGDLLYDPKTLDIELYQKLERVCERINVKLRPDASKLINKIFKAENRADYEVWPISSAIFGNSLEHKLEKIAPRLRDHGVDGFLAVKLDDIAWLLNMRGNAFPFQRTFESLAFVGTKNIVVGLKPGIALPDALKHENIIISPENELIHILKNYGSCVGIDEQSTSKAHEMALLSAGFTIKKIINPIALLKAIKNEQELLHMRSAFKKADEVIYQTQNHISHCYEEGKALSEADIDHYVRDQFARSGSQELSFRPICAAGKNAAIIHYGTPDSKEAIKAGSLFLLDTGAFYEGGYATDLTRTFLVGTQKTEALLWQKQLFTLVLKASIKGLSARFRRGLLAHQLDCLVRAPLWQAGLDYAHGTGHGVGINVHEFPPRIAGPSFSPLLEGHVFSIEPGLYFENIGGVRIENLVTVVKDPDNEEFLRILPLTFSPFDQRLIEYSMLDSFDKDFLNYYSEQWHSTSIMPALPPLPRYVFG
jgi:Xaa-Pro aminopeptidase